MNDNIKMTGVWPPCCCVAAFVFESLRQLGYAVLDRAALARQLGIRVGPDKANPWNLLVDPDPNLQGLLVSDAKRLLPNILKQYDQNLRFRHIPFRTVMFELYAEVLDQALNQGCVAGVGFNKAVLLAESGTVRHVTRIRPVDDREKVLLLDDTCGVPARRTFVEWGILEKAVHSVNDGFWIIGRVNRINFDFVPNES
jgi:hypothetical protein